MIDRTPAERRNAHRWGYVLLAMVALDIVLDVRGYLQGERHVLALFVSTTCLGVVAGSMFLPDRFFFRWSDLWKRKTPGHLPEGK